MTLVLVARGAKTLVGLGAEKQHAAFAKTLVFILNFASLDAHVIILSKKCQT